MEIRFIRRTNQGHAAFGAKAGQSGLQQTYFAYTRLAGQQFDKRTQGPALSGKLAVKVGKAGGDDGAMRAGNLAAAPQCWMDVLGRLSDRGVHQACRNQIGRASSRERVCEYG